VLKRTTSKRIDILERRVKKIEKALIYTQEIVHAKLAEAVDKKYEFGEILECLDDIMEHLNL